MVTDETTRKAINDHYQKGQGSIQDIARVYRVSVDEVLEIIGEAGLGTVTAQGDLIDPTEAGDAPLNYGKNFKVPFTTE